MFKKNISLSLILSFLCAGAALAEAPQRGRWQSRDPVENTMSDVSKFAKNGEFGKGIHTSMTIGIDGLPIIAYRKQIENREELIGDLEVIHCGNVECSAGNTITTIDRLAGFYSSIAIGGDGLPVIAYTNGSTIPDILKVAKCGNIECSSGNTLSKLENRQSIHPSVTMDLDGLPVIAYGARLESSFVLHVAKCRDHACSTAPALTGVPSVSGVAATSIAIGADGHPVIAVHDSGRGALKVVHCEISGTSGCANPVISVVDGGNDLAGEYCSLTIGDDGLPLIAYRGGTGVRVAHCDNPFCSSDNKISQLPFLGTSKFVSVTIGVEGLPRISFVQGGNELYTVQCGNKDCSSVGAFHTINSTDDTGEAFDEATSIAIGADGLPIIAYAAADKGEAMVRVTHCGSDRCLPFWTRR